MAWENYVLVNEGVINPAWFQNIPDNSTLFETPPSSYQGVSEPFGLPTDVFYSYRLRNIALSENPFLFGDANAGIKLVTSGTNSTAIEGWLNGSRVKGPNIACRGYNSSSSTNYQFNIYCAINRETQKATLFIVERLHYNNNNTWWMMMADNNTWWNSSNLYQIINPQPAYTWQSVPSISGKNGILPFTCLKDNLITGDVVSGLVNSDFTAIPGASRIEDMIAGSNLSIGQEVPIAYAGQVDYLALERYSQNVYYLNLRIGGTVPSGQSYLFTYIDSKRTFLAFCADDENEVAKLVYVSYDADTETYEYMPFDSTAEQMAIIWLFLHRQITPDDERTEDETTPEADGTIEGSWTDTPIVGLELPTKGAIDTGFTSMYEISEPELQRLSKYMWSASFVENVKKFFNNPNEIIVGLSIMPISPDTGNAKTIKAGGIDTGAVGNPLTSQYKLVSDLGSIKIDKKKKRRFLNYPPYTKITAHLPYCGCHSIDVNDVMGKTLTLAYMFDFLTGSCVAQISVDGKPKYFFGGSCGIQIPTSSEDFSRIYNGIISAGATLGATLSTIATGGMTAPLLLGSAGNMLSNGMQMTPNVDYTSGNGSINGMLTSQTAFLIIETPDEKIAEHQDRFTGRASYITKTLSDCSGYTKCFSVHLDNVPCMAQERAEIERQLLAGVRIETGSETPSYTPTTPTDHGLIFLKCISDMDVIGKSWTDPLTVEGKLLFDQSLYNPVFLMQGDFSAYNYVYVPEFDRFYYITEQHIKTGNLTQINLQEDVLQSWKTQILQNEAILERSQSDYNTYMNDPEVWTAQNKNVAIIPFVSPVGEQVNFARGNNSYIITIAGSDTTPAE